VDRYDLGEFLGLIGLVIFAGIVWLPAALLVGSLFLLVEVNLRGRGRPTVRGFRPGRKVVAVWRAARTAWAEDDAAA
jgi:hypothetical protein